MKISKKILVSGLGGIGLFVLVLLGAVVWFGNVGTMIAYVNGEAVYLYPKNMNFGNQKPGSEIVSVFYMKNMTSQEVSVVGEESSCDCVSSTELPITARAGETIELRVKAQLPKYRKDYDQVISFIVAEPERLVMHPVRVTATIPNPLEKNKTEELEEYGDTPSNYTQHCHKVVFSLRIKYVILLLHFSYFFDFYFSYPSWRS
jgi:hypothetical protein